MANFLISNKSNYDLFWIKKDYFNSTANLTDSNVDFEKNEYSFSISPNFINKKVFFAAKNISHFIEVIEVNGTGNGIKFKIGKANISENPQDLDLLFQTMEKNEDPVIIPFEITDTEAKDIMVSNLYKENSIKIYYTLNLGNEVIIPINPESIPFKIISNFTTDDSLVFYTDAPTPCNVKIFFKGKSPLIATHIRNEKTIVELKKNVFTPGTINLSIEPD